MPTASLRSLLKQHPDAALWLIFHLLKIPWFNPVSRKTPRNEFFCVILVQESPKEHPPEMCTSPRSWTPAPRRPSQHPQTRRRTVQQSPSTRLQSTQTLRHKRWSQESTRNQGRTRISTGRIYQHNQQLLSRRNRQVSWTESAKVIWESQISANSRQYFKPPFMLNAWGYLETLWIISRSEMFHVIVSNHPLCVQLGESLVWSASSVFQI